MFVGGFSSSFRWGSVGEIIHSTNALHDRDCIPTFSMYKNIGNGANTRFWKDIWCNGLVFSFTGCLLCLTLLILRLVIFGPPVDGCFLSNVKLEVE